MTVSRQSPGLTGFRYCARVQRVSGNTNTSQLQFIQTLETSNSIPLAGNPVTLSFYARKGANYSPTSNALNVILASGTGTDQYWLSFTSGATVIGQTATLTDSWQRFSYTATPSSTATQFYVMFEMNPTGTASTNDWYEVTGVQLEAGSVATPFEFEDSGTTIQKCQRYYQKSFDIGTTPTQNSGVAGFRFSPHGGGFGTQYTISLRTSMRAAPNVTGFNPSNNNGLGRNFSAGGDIGNISIYAQTTESFTVHFYGTNHDNNGGFQCGWNWAAEIEL